MTSPVNTAFARSEHLKKEWEDLREKISHTDPNNPAQHAERAALNAQMSHLTTQMAALVTETRKTIPTPDIDDSPLQSTVKYSIRHKHIICRTYSSSSDEPDDKSPQAQTPQVVTLESRPTLEANLRKGVNEFGNLIRQKLRTPHEEDDSLSDDAADLTVEQSRLQRESRKLRKLSDRSVEQEQRLSIIDARLSQIADTLSGIREPSMSTADRPNASANLNAKRKKGWKSLEAGVASLKAQVRLARNTLSPREGKATAAGAASGDLAGVESGGGRRMRGRQRKEREGGNVFGDTVERLEERGEVLESAVEDSERMGQDAGEMLAAARALRQRNQRAFFG